MCVLFVRLGSFLFFARCCCDVACDGQTSFATSLPSICPARTEVILHSGRVLIVASLRPAVRTKKGFRTNSPRNSGARGTWNKGVFVGGKHKSGQFYKRFWLEKENIEHLKSFFWLPANVRQKNKNVRGKTWQWIILQTFGEIDFVLLAVFPFAIFEVLFFRGARFETEVSECGVLLDDEGWSLHSPRAQVSQVGVDVNGECMSMFLGTKNFFSYGLVAFQAQRFVSE